MSPNSSANSVYCTTPTLAVFASAVVPLVDKLTLRWFVRDLDIRVSLIADTVQDPLQDLIRARDRPRVQGIY